MSIDPTEIKSEQHDQIGRVLERDAQKIADAWFATALGHHPAADPARRAEAYDELPELLRELGRTLASCGTADAPQADTATEHGKQRWAIDWALDDLIRDYELLRLVVLEHLEAQLGGPLTTRQAMAVNVALDDAMISSALAYTRELEDQFQEIQSTLEEKVAEQTARLREAASELVRAEQHERPRIAAILHDHLQQVRVAAQMGTSLLRGDVTEERRIARVRHVDDLIREAIDASRTLAVELDPPVLHESGLAAALHWLAGRVRDKHGLEVSVIAEKQAEPESSEMRGLVYQAVQELLLNVVKHAAVTRAGIEKRRVGDAVEVVVSDAGAGFNPMALLAERPVSYGLPTIRQRLEALGGSLRIESAPGQGTEATLRLPGYWTTGR